MPKIFISKNKYIRNTSIISAVIFLIGFGISYFKLNLINHLLIIHFTKLGGIDFLGSKIDVLSILLTGVFISFLNLAIAEFFYQRIRFISYLLGFFNIFLATLILIAIAVIISVN